MSPRARQDGLMVEGVGEELVVYDQKRHRAHRLNRSSAWIWRHCDGETSVAQLAALLAAELALPADEKVIRLALKQLERAHLLRDPLPSARGGVRVSRRAAVRTLGTAGALSLLLPMVSSITVPTPAMAQSDGMQVCGYTACGSCELPDGSDGEFGCVTDGSDPDCAANTGCMPTGSFG